jgi:PTH1 family peptidyl-tRNA hydrolase
MENFRLLVGLGNPGKEYQSTRHNAGAWWVSHLVDQKKLSFRKEAKFFGSVANLKLGDKEILLMLPQTFMNESGKAVGAVARFYKIQAAEILIAHDELDLPCGTVKLKRGGGVGGHNGLKDIAAQMGSQDFWRLRLGIGHPGDASKVSGFVLNAPTKQESVLINDAITRSLEIFPQLVKGDTEAAMKKLHTKEKEEK